MEPSQLDEAVRAVHAAHASALRAWVRQRVGDPGEVDDVVQEVLLRAWRHRDQFDPERGSERAWLFGIARNVTIDRHRRGRRHLSTVAAVDDLASPGDSEVDRAVEVSHIQDALRSLSPAHRDVIVEVYYRGRTLKEAASHLAVPEGTVKSRLYYGLRALRSELIRVEVLP